MRLIKKNRKFIANNKTNVVLKDVGKVILQNNELLSLQKSNKKNEICAKEWGFYLTPSINKRLKKQNLIVVLTKNNKNKKFLMLVNKSKLKIFKNYCKKESLKIINWIK